jgi:hypothetical protein
VETEGVVYTKGQRQSRSSARFRQPARIGAIAARLRIADSTRISAEKKRTEQEL